ncbi:MAG: TRAP transporter small permease [Hyphomicrobiaceae bacterium]
MTPLVELIERLLLRLGVISGFATLMILIIVVVDVAGRAIFNSPLHSGVEISELLLVTLVFLGLGAAQQQRQNFAIEVFVRHLPRTFQTALELIGYLVCIGIVVLLAWPSTDQAIASFNRNEMGFGIVPFPIWPARFLLAVGLWLLALQFLCDIYRLTTGQSRDRAPSVEQDGVGS